MSFADSNTFAVGVEAAVDPGTVPSWLANKPALTWIEIPSTRLQDGNLAPLASIPGAETGLAMIGYGDGYYYKPIQAGGIDSQSGGCLRTSGSELLIFGGGGAGSWAGNDIRGLRLADNAPRWTVHSPPAADYWPRLHVAYPSHAYTQTSKQPNSRHSYFGPQFCDATDNFFQICCGPVFETDAMPPSPDSDTVERFNFATKQWVLSDDVNHSPSTINQREGWPGAWCVKHPYTEQIYRSALRYIHRFDPLAAGGVGQWFNYRYTHPTTDVDRATAAIDPDHNIILAIGQGPAYLYALNENQNRALVYDLSTTPYTAILNVSLIGPYAPSVHSASTIAGDPNSPDVHPPGDDTLWAGFRTWSNGMCWDPGLHCFLWYQDNGFLYTITRGASNAEWIVDKLNVGGTPPPRSMSNGSEWYPTIYGRMVYCPELQGVAIQMVCDKNVYFVRTV